MRRECSHGIKMPVLKQPYVVNINFNMKKLAVEINARPKLIPESSAFGK